MDPLLRLESHAGSGVEGGFSAVVLRQVEAVLARMPWGKKPPVLAALLVLGAIVGFEAYRWLKVPAPPPPRPVAIRRVNGLAVQSAGMEVLPDVTVEGADRAAAHVFVWYRAVDGSGQWHAVEARRLDGEAWRAFLSLPMDGANARGFELAAASGAPRPTSGFAPAEALVVRARAPHLALETAAAEGTVVTVAGTIAGAPAHARVCLFGRNDDEHWRVLAMTQPRRGLFVAEVATRDLYQGASRFTVVALAVDDACPELPFEPTQAKPRGLSNDLSMAVPARVLSIAEARAGSRVRGMTSFRAAGRADHLLHGERLWVQAFPAGGGNALVAEAEVAVDRATWTARLELPHGRWRLYPVVFSAPPRTVAAPAQPAFEVVAP